MRLGVLLFMVTSYFMLSAQCNGGRYEQKVFSQVKVTKNIVSHAAINASGRMQNIMMDVYEPQNDTASLRPLIVFQHGGAYWTGTKDYQSQIAMGNEFAKRGYVLASATYRQEPSFISLIFQDLMLKAVGRGVQDTKQELRYFYNSARDSANPFRIDTNRIFLCGASAGAFNVLHSVYLDQQDSLPAQWLTWLNQIGGVFDTYDFKDFGSSLAGIVNINGALGNQSFLDNEHLPFLSVHNIWDPEIPFNRGRPYNIASLMYVDGSNILHQKAQQLQIYNPFYIIPDNGHTSYSSDFFGTVVQPFFDSTVWYMNKFFTHQLGCDLATPVIYDKIKQAKIYPNPTTDFFNIDAAFSDAKSIQIFDLYGKLLITLPFKTGYYTTGDLHLNNGIYILSLIDDKGEILSTGKLTITK